MINRNAKAGLEAEVRFKTLASNMGFQAHTATIEHDIVEHWDVHLNMKVDVKAMKRVNCYDMDPQEGWHWLEIRGVGFNNKGWIYGSHANACGFETKSAFILVTIEKLKELIREKVSKDYVKEPDKAHYKLYSRGDKNDIITLVKTSDLREIGWEMDKKYLYEN